MKITGAKVNQPVQTMGRGSTAAIRAKAGAVAGLSNAQSGVVDHLAKVGAEYIERKERMEVDSNGSEFMVESDAWQQENAPKEYFTAGEVEGKIPAGSVQLTKEVSDADGVTSSVPRMKIPRHEVYPYLLDNKMKSLTEAKSAGITNPIKRAAFIQKANEYSANRKLTAGLKAANEQKVYENKATVANTNKLLHTKAKPQYVMQSAEKLQGTPSEKSEYELGTQRQLEWRAIDEQISNGNVPAMQTSLAMYQDPNYGKGEHQYFAEDRAAGGPHSELNRYDAIKRLESALKSETSRKTKVNTYEYNNAVKSATVGDGPGFVDAEWIDSQDTWNDEEKRVRKLQLADANVIGEWTSKNRLTSASEDMTTAKTITDMEGQQNINRKTGIGTTFSKAMTEKQSAIRADRAAYVLKHSTPSRKAHADMMAARGEPGFNAARDKYVSYMSSAQNDMAGYIPRVYLLSTGEVTDIKLALAGTEDAPIAADVVSQKLETMHQEWGDHWPIIHDQLVQQDAITPAQSVVASQNIANRALSIEVLRSVNVKEADYKRDIPDYKTTVAGYSDQATAALEEFKNTFEGPNFDLPGGREEYTKYHEAIVNVLKYRAQRSNGQSQDDAQSIAASLINDKYSYRGTMRIPSNLDDGDIAASAHVMKGLDRIADKEIWLGSMIVSGDELQAQAHDVIWKEGIWVTNPNETGMQLIWPTKGGQLGGQPVTYKDEDGSLKPFSATWEEFELYAIQYAEEVQSVQDASEDIGGGAGMVPAFKAGTPTKKKVTSKYPLKAKATGNAL